MSHKITIEKSPISKMWLVSEGGDVFGGSGRIVGQFKSLKEAKKRAKERKEIVGYKEPITINKILYYARLEGVI